MKTGAEVARNERGCRLKRGRFRCSILIFRVGRRRIRLSLQYQVYRTALAVGSWSVDETCTDDSVLDRVRMPMKVR